MTRIKICGITNLDDALAAVEFGADEVGLNFYPGSPRYVSPEKARKITDGLPERVVKVGVFVNERIEDIYDIAETARLDAIQLHGDEPREFADAVGAKTGLGIIKAVRVKANFDPDHVLEFRRHAILLDAFAPWAHGGTGRSFDWRIARAAASLATKLYLAGGLSPENVEDAIRTVRPFAVDVCSSVEREPGKKDTARLKLFIGRVRKANEL